MKTFGPASAKTSAMSASHSRTGKRSPAGGFTATSRTKTRASGGKKKAACPCEKPMGTSEG